MSIHDRERERCLLSPSFADVAQQAKLQAILTAYQTLSSTTSEPWLARHDLDCWSAPGMFISLASVAGCLGDQSMDLPLTSRPCLIMALTTRLMRLRGVIARSPIGDPTRDGEVT